MARRSSGVRRFAQAETVDRELQEFQDFYESFAETGEAPEGDGDGKLTLEMVLGWDGNIAELVDEGVLNEVGRLVVAEYELDEKDRSEWKATAQRALDMASQKKKADRTYPFDKASNVQYPLLTTASIQFAARAYPAIVRGDEVVEAKPLGEDAQGEKANRAMRSAAFVNDQLIYGCDEWEPGTDSLLHALPVVGAAFRKVYWDTALKRPRLDFASAINVVIPINAPSLELAPRITHELQKYPYEIEKLTRGDDAAWLQHTLTKDTGDSQKPVDYLEQCRYIDLDDDGLSEPYIVTVHKDTAKVVRIDPAFDEEDIKRSEDGSIYCINRLLPWVDYCFLPDPQGGAYGVGFGKLLESIGAVIDTTLNELIDAGHLANTNTGFIGQGIHTRGGDMDVRVNSFRMLPGVTDVRNAIMKLDFPGPNPVLFQLLEFLIETAKDITSVKDVLTGDAPGQQPATSTLALIEQGLQVFTAIYKRIYRSMTREFELVYRLNHRYLDAKVYQDFLDSQPPQPQEGVAPQETNPQPMLGHNGGPPLSPGDMGADPAAPSLPPGGEVVPFPAPPGAAGQAQGAPMPPQAQPQPNAMTPPPGLQGAIQAGLGSGQLNSAQSGSPLADPRKDFDLSDMDIRPIADPTAVTEMQRLARANFLKQTFTGDPTINQVEVNKRVLAAARIADINKLVVEKNPMIDAQAQAQVRMATAQAAAAEADVALKQAQTVAAQLEPQLKQADLQIKGADLEMRQGHMASQIAIAEGDQQLKQADVQLKMVQARAQEAATALEWRKLGLAEGDLDIKRNDAAVREAETAARLEQEDAKIAIDAEDRREKAAQGREQLRQAMVKALMEERSREEDRALQREEGGNTRAFQREEKRADREHQSSEGEKGRKHQSEDKAQDREHKSRESSKDRSLARESGDKEREHKSAEGDKERRARTAEKAAARAQERSTSSESKGGLTSPRQGGDGGEMASAIKDALVAFAEAARRSSAPKELVRDPKTGKPIGVRTVEE